ncbi:DNA mismatch repair endonuclease MutL [Brevibacillus ruminantium]|uniref:DNA mismatch repair protein MutL n=1 Tax=Brevibacillus ruminantium TaxID=2950604 RepID=A0ABY4WLM5_9BACL|nr:DNA mismatch repair endonuclease MutL [Brevibacillus ruminantium]USG68037.1 DNA mismatch repair endonuclease MutL [Brevibacillus ruminantium]
MGKIHVLEEHLTNMIAAGEVVERPASVVKELVENAIDAGASSVEIHVEEGGLSLIRVVDNGQGMDEEDCRLAFERHATSKIRQTRDLFRIRTLGFRGEALPSIAAVSRVELTSTQSSGQVGTRLTIEGGAIKGVSEIATVKGTEIAVRDLFFNTPARLKYMKSISTEIGHISDYVNRLALTYPAVSFTLTHNSKTLLQTSGDGKLLHVMAAIYGVQVAKLLLPIEGETLDFRWSGFISKTEVTRANRSYLSTLVNGRYVRHYGLHNAIMRGYHTLLPIGRYPIVTLQIEMDPTLLDVNVHPAKLEVRFSKEDELCTAIEACVKNTLLQGLDIVRPMAAERKARVIEQVVQPQFDLTWSKPGVQDRSGPEVSIPSAGAGVRLANLPGQIREAREARDDMRYTLSSTSTQPFLSEGKKGQPLPVRTDLYPGVMETKRADQEDDNQAATDSAYEKNPEIRGREEAAEPNACTEPDRKQPDQAKTPYIPLIQDDVMGKTDSETKESVPPLYPVGQVHGTYIVAQNENGMYLIDQHAAQERIFYEHFMQKLAEEGVASQMLLFPHTIELTAQEALKLEKRLPLLHTFGLEIESFGSKTYIVRAHPHWFPEGSEIEVIEELVQFVLESGESAQADIRAMREKAAILMACKASIKANRFLTHAEMESLLNQLRDSSSPFTCPHGRPIIIHFTSYDLEKMFKRVM